MDTVEKPPKMKLRMAAEIFFSRNPESNIVAIITKEGREFFFRRDPLTDEPVKISQAEAIST